MDLVRFEDVAGEVGLDFRHGAFQWETGPDPTAMMGGGVCWIDYDRDGWLDLYAVNTWSNGEWGRWRAEGGLPSSRLYRNDAGRFVDVTDTTSAGLESRGNGCVAADLDLDGWTDLYVTTERGQRVAVERRRVTVSSTMPSSSNRPAQQRSVGTAAHRWATSTATAGPICSSPGTPT